MTRQEKIQRLQDCIALLSDVDAMQQTVLFESEDCLDIHHSLDNLIDQFAEKLEELQNEE